LQGSIAGESLDRLREDEYAAFWVALSCHKKLSFFTDPKAKKP